jgi:hypothetical protein
MEHKKRFKVLRCDHISVGPENRRPKQRAGEKVQKLVGI